MLLFAESVTTNDLGMVLLAFLVLITLIEKAKLLLWPTRTVQEEYVRKADLDAFKNEMKNDIQTMTTQITVLVPRTEFTRLESQLGEISKEYKELREYTHTRIHELTTKMHEIQLRMEVLHRDSQRDLERSTDKIITQIERMTGRGFDANAVGRPTILAPDGTLIKS